MEDSLTRKAKLLALISEIRHIIGPFDARSILLKANIDEQFEEPGIGEDVDSINPELVEEEASAVSHVVPKWKNERVAGCDSLLISPNISSSARPAQSAISESADSIRPLSLSRPNDDDGYFVTNICDDISPMRSKVDYSENTLFLNRQAKHPASVENVNVDDICITIDETAMTELPVTLSKFSAPVCQDVRALIIGKDIDTFLQDLPTNSPVRSIITNSVTSVSPSRRALEAAKRGIDPSGYKLDKYAADSIITDGDAEVNFIEFVTVGYNQKSILGLESAYQRMSNISLKALSEEQRSRLEILDHFRSDVTDRSTMCMIETISDYCFPIGTLIDIVRKEDLIDFTSPANDSFHVMQFSDVTGTPTYACCLTTVEVMLPPNKAVIKALIMQKRMYSRAVAIIIRAFRYCSRKRKELLYFSTDQIAETEFSIFDMKHSFYSMNTPFKFGVARNVSDGGEGDLKQSVTAGFGSVIMSRLKKGISFAGGRTVEKHIPATTPFVKTNKALWGDIDEDTEDAEFCDVERLTAHDQSELDDEESVGNEKELEGGVSADDENSEGDDDGRSSDDGEDAPRVRREAPRNALSLFGAEHLHHEQSQSLEANARICTPKLQEKDVIDVPPVRDLGTTAKGHSLRELEGLHLHGFSSESEGEGEVTGEEGGERSTADPDSSFESASNSSVKSRSHTKDEMTAVRPGRESFSPTAASFTTISLSCASDAGSHLTPHRDDTDIWTTSDDRSRHAGDVVQTGCRSQRVSMGSVGTRMLSPSTNPMRSPSVTLLPLMSDDVDDYALLTKKAYCLIGPKPLHSLFFSILSAIAEQERQTSEASAMSCIDVSEVHVHDGPTGGDPDALVRLLDPVVESAQLVADKPEGCSIEIPTSSHPDLIAFLRHMRDCKIQSNPVSFSSLRNIPPPFGDTFIRSNVSLALQEEWTCGVLLNVLPCATIMQTLSLLLLESSLVVCGPPAGLVTAIATAFKLLLLPFEWAGIFVPILPSNALEVMEAPVPFIVGTIHTLRASCISPSAAVLCLEDFLDPWEGNFMSPVYHLNTQNLQSVRPHTDKYAEDRLTARSDSDAVEMTDKEGVTVTTDEGSSTISSSFKSAHRTHSPRGKTTLRAKRYLQLPVGEGVRGSSGHSEFSSDSSYQGLVSKLQRVKTKLRRLLFSAGDAAHPPLLCHDQSLLDSHRPLSIEVANQCMKRYLLRMSSEERRVVSEVLPLIKRHTTGLCGPLATDPFACQKYGVVNSSSGHFDFYPEMFLDPLKARLRFQEDLAHTQMFLSFIDMKREEHNRKMQENRLIRKRSASVRKKRGCFT